ncbi:TolC family protein [Pedobacter sp. BS3]|nr:TolC family protein [Pedobacter sp. BS3]
MAQEKVRFLSLKEAIEAAVSGNFAVQSGKLDEAAAREKFKQADAGFLPQLNFSYAAWTTNNPLNAFGFKLQQREVTAADFNPALLNHPSQTADFTTKLEAQQPLLNLDAIYMKKSARAQVESYQLKTQRTREYVTLETQKAYYQLQMAHQAVWVLEEALSTAKSVYEFTNNRVFQGLIQRSDLLNAEVQVLGVESSLNEAKANLLNASDYLSVLMNQPAGVLYQTEEMCQAYPQEDISPVLPENRSDFLAMEEAITAAGMMEKSFKMKFLPRLNAFGSYQLNDKRFSGFGAESYFAGIQLSWNIFDGNNNKRQAAGLKLEQQKLQVQLRSMQQENQMQLDKYHRDLASSRFKIRQQHAAVAQAEEALRILQNRYKEGLVNTTDVLHAQTQLSQQKLMLLQAIFSNQVTQAYIRFLTTAYHQQ